MSGQDSIECMSSECYNALNEFNEIEKRIRSVLERTDELEKRIN